MDHLEGNAKVIFHVATKGPGKIIIRGNHTDIFILLLENVQKFCKVNSGLMKGLTMATLATMLICPDYLKNLIM